MNRSVRTEPTGMTFSKGDKICLLGSCICDSFAERFRSSGFEVLSNPFGPLYNPVSVENAVKRLDTARPFVKEDCVQVGGGSELVCSFSHYTKFARRSEEEFLRNANDSLSQACAFWRACRKVIVIFYTAWVWERGGEVVANCLKHPSREFVHRLLSVGEAATAIGRIQGTASEPVQSPIPAKSSEDRDGDPSCGREWLFMVCPIRQGGEDCRDNTLSKATLQLAIAKEGADYFPLYEIFTDELRDWSFYREDGKHPSGEALDIAFGRLVR